MVYDGKTYRNLQDQVAYLTSMYKALGERIEEVAAQIPSKMIVEELPEEGDPLITYYVGPKGTEPNQYYEVWVWVQEEPDGPFVWRELEDTDQVDLSGYLPIQNGVTTQDQAYVKRTDGTQTMIGIDTQPSASSLVQRWGNGQVKLPNQTSTPPTDDDFAIAKRYADGHYVTKQTKIGNDKLYMVNGSDGSQAMTNYDTLALAGFAVRRAADGQIILPNQGTYTPTEDQAISPRYANHHYLAKQMGATTSKQVYTKEADGSQSMTNLRELSSPGAIPQRDSYGQIYLPDQSVYTPSDDQAVSKRYVNAAVGQLLYLHDIVLAYDIDGTNSLFIRCFLINGSATALTSLTRGNFARLTIGAGGIGTGASNMVTPCAITKLPESFRFDNLSDAYDGFMYQYFSDGSLVSASVENGANTLTVTDSVTTW